MTEAQLQRAVIELAHRLGWKVAHFRPAQVRPGVWATPVEADGAGFPDLVMVRKGRLLFVELKTEKGEPSKQQVAWLEELTLVARAIWDLDFGEDIFYAQVWRPSDWSSGHIETILR